MTNPFAMPENAAPATPASTPAAQPAPAASPAGDDPFGAPAPQAPKGPRFRELYGRLLLLIPTKLEEGITSTVFKNTDGSAVIQDRMTADVIVLDGGDIHYGGKPEKMPPEPHTMSATVPHKTAGQYISYTGIISQCREALHNRLAKRPGTTMVLGRLTRGQDTGKGEPPWILTPATDADKALAREWIHKNPADPFA